MKKLSDRWMYYSGLLAMHGVGVEDLKHIQDLIDAEEQGLLLRLPVAEGTEVFAIMESYFYEEFGYGVEPWYSICGENFDRNMIEYFGKTVFLTREEAETALEKMKGE